MLISHSKEFIFIHNYKVAGSSVTEALGKYGAKHPQYSSVKDKLYYKFGIYPKVWSGGKLKFHSKAKEIKGLIPDKIFDSYFKFGFVRNPWDWQVSLYNYGRTWKDHHQRELMLSFKTFDEYIEWRVNNEIRLQKEFFYDDKGNCLVDFVGKFEQLEKDFDEICQKLKIKAVLPHTNKTNMGKPFLSYYSPKSVDLIYEAFIDDVKTFGYEKPVLS